MNIIIQAEHTDISEYAAPKATIFDADIEQAVDTATISYRRAIRLQFRRTRFDDDLADDVANCRIRYSHAMLTQLQRDAKRNGN
jgi:hypothetical protein